MTTETKFRAKQYRAPTFARLARDLHWVERANVIKVRRIIRGTLDPFEVFGRFRFWYETKTTIYDRMLAIDALIEGHGVETITHRARTGERVDVADYVNTGDTYRATIVYCYKARQFQLTSWGDYVERNKVRD